MSKSRVYSVLTALPPLMLMIGLYVYYRAEQAQLAGPPILAEGVVWTGQYKGTSTVKSLGEKQLFLWLDTKDRARGMRLTEAQLLELKESDKPLVAGDGLSVQVAPRVVGSTTYWLVSMERL